MKLHPLEFHLLKVLNALLTRCVGQDETLLLNVNVSGGKDSVALFHGLSAVLSSELFAERRRVRMVVQHFNHKKRGAESDLDEDFVVNMALEHGVPVFVETFPERNEDGNFQDVARRWRKRESLMLCEKLCEQWNCSRFFVVTAHHARDAVESVLLHLLRGAGVEGLKGIEELDETACFWRPLSKTLQLEITQYLNEKKISHRTDTSNYCEDYSRNFLRINVLPQLERIAPALEQVFLRNSENAREVSDQLKKHALPMLQNSENMIYPSETLKLNDEMTAGELIRRARFIHPELAQVLTRNAAENILHHFRISRRNTFHSFAVENRVNKIALRDGWTACLCYQNLVFSRETRDN